MDDAIGAGFLDEPVLHEPYTFQLFRNIIVRNQMFHAEFQADRIQIAAARRRMDAIFERRLLRGMIGLPGRTAAVRPLRLAP
jgi:hypothetical protein